MTQEEEGTILHSVTSLGLSYSVCYSRYCDHRCNVSDTKWYPLCHCDQYCEPLGDCCYSYQQCVKERLNDDVMMTLLVLAAYTKCKNEDPWYPDNVMVRECPKTSTGFKRECESLNGLVSVENQPYTHIKSGLTFRNVYCALCHAISLDEIRPWNVKTEGKCQPMDRTMTLVDHIHSRTDYEYCPDGRTDPKVTDRRCAPSDKRPERFCDVDGKLRDKCDISRKEVMGATTYKFVEEACLSYEAPIMVRHGTTHTLFKNSFCVECSDFSSRDDLRCPAYYCNLPLRPDKPSLRPAALNETIRHDLELNLDRLLFVVRGMRRRCRPYPSKRLRKECREGYIKYNKQCIPDLLDNTTFAKPVNGEEDVLTLGLALNLPQPVRMILKGYDIGPELRRMFTRLIKLMIPFLHVDDVIVTSNFTRESVMGGAEVTFEGPISVGFRVEVANQTDSLGVDDLVVRLLRHSRTMAATFTQLDPRLTIATGNVTFPIRCAVGQHLHVPLDRPYFSLYRHHYDADQLFRSLVLVFHPSDSKYPIMHACTKPVVHKKLSDCPLMAYSRDDFSAVGNKLVFQYTSIELDADDYYVLGGKLFTCVVLPSGQRVTRPIRKQAKLSGSHGLRPAVVTILIGVWLQRLCKN